MCMYVCWMLNKHFTEEWREEKKTSIKLRHNVWCFLLPWRKTQNNSVKWFIRSSICSIIMRITILKSSTYQNPINSHNFTIWKRIKHFLNSKWAKVNPKPKRLVWCNQRQFKIHMVKSKPVHNLTESSQNCTNKNVGKSNKWMKRKKMPTTYVISTGLLPVFSSLKQCRRLVSRLFFFFVSSLLLILMYTIVVL